MFGGMAQRMAYALQLHKDLDHDPKHRRSSEKSELTFTDREIRRRTMWSCFLMDRFNSRGTERPNFVGEQYIVAQLPIKESYYQMEITGPTEDLEGEVPNPVKPEIGQMADAKDNMGVSAYLIRLVAIWGKLINYMNLGGKELDKYPMWDERSKFHILRLAAQDWKISLPDTLVWSPENLQNHVSEKTANQFIFLHIVYNVGLPRGCLKGRTRSGKSDLNARTRSNGLSSRRPIRGILRLLLQHRAHPRRILQERRARSFQQAELGVEREVPQQDEEVLGHVPLRHGEPPRFVPTARRRCTLGQQSRQSR